MKKDGVFLENEGGIGDDYAHLVTTDSAIAKKYDMIEEREFWGEEDEGEPDSGEEPPVS